MRLRYSADFRRSRLIFKHETVKPDDFYFFQPSKKPRQSATRESQKQQHGSSWTEKGAGARGSKAGSKAGGSGSISSSKDKQKQARDQFREKVSKVVVQSLNAYLRSECTSGRIKSADHFKFLARKVRYYDVITSLLLTGLLVTTNAFEATVPQRNLPHSESRGMGSNPSRSRNSLLFLH